MKPGAGSIPDLGWIRRNIPIADVAKALDLRFDGKMIFCWRPPHEDLHASVSINKTTNRVKCFGCNTPTMGVVDLVMDVRGIDVKDAACWLENHFSVERIAKGKHLTSPATAFRVGYEDPIGLLVKSGIWASFIPPTRSIVPVLLSLSERAEKDTFSVTCSYRAIVRESGVKSFNCISKALDQLEELGWLTIQQVQPAAGQVLRKVNTYILTPYSNSIMELANGMAKQKRKDMESERTLRKVQRKVRQEAIDAATLAIAGSLPRTEPVAGLYKVQALYPHDSVKQFPAITTIASNVERGVR